MNQTLPESLRNFNVAEYRHYSSFMEYVQAAIAADILAGDTVVTSRNSKDANFNSHPNWAVAMHDAKHGWQAGKDAMQRATANLIGTGKQRESFVVDWDVCGSIVDVAAYNAGLPDCMITFSPVLTPGKSHITIGIETGMAGNTDKQCVFNRGAALLGLIDALESNGIRVKLQTTQTNSSSTYQQLFVCDIKQHEDVVNYDTLAFVLCAADYNRRMAFAIRDTYPKDTLRMFGYSGGYGQQIPSDDPYITQGLKSLFDVYYYHRGIEDTFETAESSKRWLDAEVKRIAIMLGRDINVA